MGFGEREQQTRRPTVGSSLSSLIVRPSENEGGGGANDYEPGEVHREKNNAGSKNRSHNYSNGNSSYKDRSPIYSRSPRYSGSPLRSRPLRFSDRFDVMDEEKLHGYKSFEVAWCGLRMWLLSKYGSEHVLIEMVKDVDAFYHCRKLRLSVTELGASVIVTPPALKVDCCADPRSRMDYSMVMVLALGHGNGMLAGSVSPLRQRMKHAGSASPLHQRMHVGSLSPPRQRKLDHHYGSDFEHAGGPHNGPGYKAGRGSGRFREFSPPPYGRGRVDRSFGRGFGSFDGFGRDPSPLREESIGRNNPNVSPREGDWICSEPSCGNLNFARRVYCNNCNRLRFAPRGNGPGGSPRGNFFRPPSPHAPVPRFVGPPMDRGKGRDMNGYGSPHGWGGGGPREPPRNWGRDEPRDFKMDPPPPRHVERFSGDRLRRERPVYPEVGYRGRGKFDRSLAPEWSHRGRGRGNFFNDRRWYDENDHQLSSPPLPLSPPRRGPWVSDRRDRSRSPFRSGLRDYGRDPFISRGRDYQQGMGRVRRFHGEY
ncbi:hypothetical protein ACLOJK_040245 [Asimina triloba]